MSILKITKLDNEYFDYDKVIIATHADEAKNMIENKSEDENKILGSFKYKKNLAIIHSDDVVMPKKKINWSAWNTSISQKKSSVTYWLNLLQNFNISKNIFLTLNPFENINRDKYRNPYDTLSFFEISKVLVFRKPQFNNFKDSELRKFLF